MIRFFLFPIALIRLSLSWSALCAEQGFNPRDFGHNFDFSTRVGKSHKSAYIFYLWTLDYDLYRKYMNSEYHLY